MKKSLLAIFFWLINISLITSQEYLDDLSFKDRMQPLKEENIFMTAGYFNWCPSIIKGDNGEYHLFYSRWEKKYFFRGWLTHSEVAHAVSNSPSGPWKYVETVLASRGRPHWDAVTVHNPKIKFFDGRYYLYYISTNLGDIEYSEENFIEVVNADNNWLNILRPNQRTGVAFATSIYGPWTRFEQPLIEPSGPITTLTVNPAVTKGKDQQYFLIVKGDKPNETRFIRNQAIAISDSPTGPFVMQPKAVIDDLDTEDISMWYDANRDLFYAVFHAHKFIGMICSQNGINWSKASEYVILENKLKMADGSVIVPDAPLQRPFVYVENNEPQVLSLAVKKGDDSYLVFIPISKNIINLKK